MTTEPGELEPIRTSWKVSHLLSKYPYLLEELVALNPAFRLLRNPLTRRVQARLVTVGQAAQIANMEPERLVSALNAAIGCTTSSATGSRIESSVATDAAPPWLAAAPIAAEVDARQLQREGAEPFGRIMAAARMTRTGQVLRLLSSFEPVPLYEVMEQRGFEHWSRKLGADDWEIRFFRSGHERGPAVFPSASPVLTDDSRSWESPAATITIDVSELVPPEPLVRIMEALERLAAGESLLVHHVRRPVHLYPRLDELGYRHQTREPGPGKVELLIEKPAAAR